MRWNSTVALLLITVGLGAYVSLHELRLPPREESETRSRRIVDVPPDDVTEISVKWPAVSATLKRVDGDWQLTAPLSVPADPTHVDRLLRQLGPLDAERVLKFPKDMPPKLSEFGLDPPVGTITLTLRSGPPITLLFGEATALGENQYAKAVDSPNIFIVHTGNRLLLDQPIEAYRSHDVWRFEPFRADRLAIQSADVAYTMEKRQGRWFFTEPIQDAVDNAEASMLLSRLRNLRSERLILEAAKPEDLPAHGLDSPYVRVELTLDGGDSKTLLIGNPVKDAESLRSAKAEDDSQLHGVLDESVRQWLKPANDFRSRSSLEFFAGQVSRVQITSDGKTWTAEEQADQWRHVETAVPLDAKKMEAFFWKIHDTKFTRFLEDQLADPTRYGLASPSAGIRIWTTGSSEPQELAIGAATEQGGRYAMVSGRTVVAELPAAVTELLATTPESLSAPVTTPPEESAPPSPPEPQPSPDAAATQ